MSGPLDLILPARPLDDLHDVAVAARSPPEVEARLAERVDALEIQASVGEASLEVESRLGG